MSLLHCCNAGWPRANGGSGAQATRARSPSYRSPGYLSDGCRGVWLVITSWFYQRFGRRHAGFQTRATRNGDRL
jgi:hypothetical protein